MRRAFPAFLAFMVTVAGLIIWHEASTHQEAKRRAVRQLKYEGEASSLEQVIRPGMQRREVDAILKNQAWKFTLRGRNEIVPLARESAAEWYCSWNQVQVLIEFTPGVTSEISATSDPYDPLNPRADDRVKSIGIDRWAQDCM
jgi:hypothetical protein